MEVLYINEIQSGNGNDNGIKVDIARERNRWDYRRIDQQDEDENGVSQVTVSLIMFGLIVKFLGSK